MSCKEANVTVRRWKLTQIPVSMKLNWADIDFNWKTVELLVWTEDCDIWEESDERVLIYQFLEPNVTTTTIVFEIPALTTQSMDIWVYRYMIKISNWSLSEPIRTPLFTFTLSI